MHISFFSFFKRFDPHLATIPILIEMQNFYWNGSEIIFDPSHLNAPPSMKYF